MKHLIITLLIVAFFIACKDLKVKDEIIPFIPGTYIAYYENEFHKTNDTLFIKQEGISKTVYNIKNAIYYTTIIDGRVLTPVYKKEYLTGIYDTKNKILTEQKHGYIIVFNPLEKALSVNGKAYKKIN